MYDNSNILKLMEDIKAEEPDKKLKAIKKVVYFFEYETPFKVLQQLLKGSTDLKEEIKPLISIYNLVVNTLSELLSSNEDNVVSYAVRALGKIGTGNIINDLLRTIREHENIDLRVNAIKAIGNIKDIKAVPFLAELASGDNDTIREAAIAELEELSRFFPLDTKTVKAVESLKDDTNKNVRYWANRILSYTHNPKSCNGYPLNNKTSFLYHGPRKIPVYLPINDHIIKSTIKNVIGRPFVTLRDLLIAIIENNTILMARILLDNWRQRGFKKLLIQWLSDKGKSIFLRVVTAYAIIAIRNDFGNVQEKLVLALENIIKDRDEHLEIVELSKRIAEEFCGRLIQGKNTFDKGISLLSEIIEHIPATIAPFDYIHLVVTEKIMVGHIQINNKTYLDYDKGIFFAQKKLEFI